MFLRSLFVTLLCVICSLASNAQKNFYNFSKVDIDNGLSNNQVYSVYRDSTGFVWFGTASGLNRFDGYSCKVFVNIPGDSASLGENYVTDIFALPGNKLWIASQTVASVYDPLTEKFDRNSQDFLKQLGLPQSKISFAQKGKKGDYWFLFEKDGLYKYSDAAHSVTHVAPVQKDLKAKSITGISEDLQGNIWVIYSNGYLQLLESNSLKPLQQSLAVKNLFANGSFDFRVFCDRQNKLWVYTSGLLNGIVRVDPINNGIKQFKKTGAINRLNDDMIKGIIQDQKGALWVGTDHGGINVIDEADNSKITFLVNKENDKNCLGYNSIEHIYQDKQGLIWVGTGKKGVSYVNQNIVQFELYQFASDNKNSLPFNDVNFFVEDKKGNVWIAANGGGLIYFDRINNRFTRYVNDPSNKNSLSNNVVVSLYLDHEDMLWIGTYHGGLDVFDGKNFVHYRHDPSNPNSIADDRVWHITEDRNNTMWIGTLQGGLNSFDRKTKKFTRYYLDGETPKPLHSNYIPVIREDKAGNLWVGTSEGLEVFNKDRTQVTHYKHTHNPNSISHRNVQEIVEDKRGLIWIGTRNGLNLWNKETRDFTSFYVNDGLPDNLISNIVEDKDGNLWITTPKGLCQLLIKSDGKNVSFEVRNFNENNNVLGKVFNESAALVTSTGQIFIGGSTGFNIIDPQKVKASTAKPKLVFTNIDIFNNEVNVGEWINKDVILRKALPFVDEVALSHHENIFSIEFAALDFSGNNQYAYKLEGFNKNWMFTNSNNRKVTYTNLDPGNYYFKVRATNSDGVWSTEVKTLKIIIKPPFWKTPFAFLLYLLALAGILFLVRRYTLEKAHMRFEVKQQKKESERIQALDALKTKFFTNVSHEFRTPLSLILTPLERIVKNTGDKDQKKQLQLVQRNAKRLLSLVNQLLDFRKMEVQEFKLQPTEGDIVKFVKESSCSFSDISEMKNITLSFNSNVDSLITYFDKDKLEKILFNLLSNAFKYTPSKGSVAVETIYTNNSIDEEEIKIIVKDSGIGIMKENHDKVFERFFQNDVPANITNPGTGIGLSITKEFVKLHNGTVTIKSEPDKGTSFIVTLPVHKLEEHFQPVQQVHEMLTRSKEKEQVGAKHNKTGSSCPVILLVEDNDDFRFYLKDNLKQEYEVIETVDGQEAWEMLEKIKPDLIVSDVMMPHMDGIELTKRIRNNESMATTPIILLTAVGDEDLQLESYRLGVNDYMTKPFTYELLAFRIKNILEQHKQTGTKVQKFVQVNPTEIEIEPADDQFLKRVLEVIEKNISVPEFTVEELSKELFMHRAGMYRKLLLLTGKTPLEFIRNIRLKRGRQLLERSQMNIAEIAYEVGFNSPKKFSQHFKEEFGVTPSQFQKQASQKV